MLSINWPVLLVQIVTFAIFAILAWSVYLKPLGKHLKERADGIAHKLDEARAAREETEKLKAQTAQDMEEFKARQKKLLEEARAEGARLREELLTQARAEQESLLEKARKQVEQETTQARRQLREEAATLVVAATRKLLAESLDAKDQEKAAEKFVKELVKTGN
jgi:F-type H+-transporting ATPase subunit b